MQASRETKLSSAMRVIPESNVFQNTGSSRDDNMFVCFMFVSDKTHPRLPGSLFVVSYPRRAFLI